MPATHVLTRHDGRWVRAQLLDQYRHQGRWRCLITFTTAPATATSSLSGPRTYGPSPRTRARR